MIAFLHRKYTRMIVECRRLFIRKSDVLKFRITLKIQTFYRNRQTIKRTRNFDWKKITKKWKLCKSQQQFHNSNQSIRWLLKSNESYFFTRWYWVFKTVKWNKWRKLNGKKCNKKLFYLRFIFFFSFFDFKNRVEEYYTQRKRCQLTRWRVDQHSSSVRSLIAAAAALFGLDNCNWSHDLDCFEFLFFKFTNQSMI